VNDPPAGYKIPAAVFVAAVPFLGNRQSSAVSGPGLRIELGILTPDISFKLF